MLGMVGVRKVVDWVCLRGGALWRVLSVLDYAGIGGSTLWRLLSWFELEPVVRGVTFCILVFSKIASMISLFCDL